MKKLFDKKLLKFLLVGAGNTALSAGIMYALYNLAGVGFWPATATAYIAGGILSFVLNRSFTFEQKEPVLPAAARFTVTVAVCYAVAYSLAQPVVVLVLGRLNLSEVLRDNLAMLTGMCLYTGLNYLGQRFFAFKQEAG